MNKDVQNANRSQVRVTWLLIGLVLSFICLQAAAGPLADFQDSRHLAAGESWVIDIDEGQEDFLWIENNGFDTLAQAVDTDGNVVSQSASWRGREGRYLLALPNVAASVQIRNLENREIPGQVRISWIRQNANREISPQVEAGLQKLAYAGDRHSSHSNGDDAHRQALEAYQAAVDSLANSHFDGWIADIYFEIGVIHRHMGFLAEANKSNQLALEKYQSLDDIHGMASANNALGVVSLRLGDRDAALEHFYADLNLRAAQNNSYFQARALNNIAVVNWQSDNYLAATQAYEQAVPLFAGQPELNVIQVLGLTMQDLASSGDVSDVATAVNNLAVAKSSIGEVSEAEALWQDAVRLAEYSGNQAEQALAMLNLGKFYQEQGRLESALTYLDSAAEVYSNLNINYRLADALMGIGNVYASINEQEHALNYYQRALTLSGEDQQLNASILSLLAKANWRLGNVDQANTQFVQARNSFAASSQQASAAVVLSEHGMLLNDIGRKSESLRNQYQAIDTLTELGQLREASRAQSRLGQLLLTAGDTEQAKQHLETALEGHRAVDDELFELDTLTALSRAQTGVAALDAARTATELAGRIRLRTASPDIQASFLASRRGAFERYIDLLVDGDDIEGAWAVSEQIRARNLLDLIQLEESDSSGLTEIRDQRDSLLAGLAAASKVGDNTQINNLRREIDLLNGQLRSNRSAQNLMRDLQAPLDPEAVQGQLGRDTAMLSYFVGENRSHMWLISDDAVEHYDLPGAEELSPITEGLTQALRSHRQSPSRISYLAEQLSNLVLQPVAENIHGRDLIVVADGSLQLVPFGLLPVNSEHLLVDNSTITYSPSAKIFDLLDVSASAMGQGNIVVLADPMTGATDPLSQSQPDDLFPGPDVNFDNLVAQRSLSQSGVSISALPGARLEAAAIRNTLMESATVLEQDSFKVLTGEQASHQFVQGGGLRGYNVVHFATHGIIDADLPELSGLVLAGDAPSDQTYLRPHEIAALEIDADLVVLSGCETGIGKSVGSEGLMSLSRPFLVAGARQVVSSLWQVSDRATAVLMERFYYHLLRENQSPEHSLRLAQQWLRQQPDWQHPYFWAGFVVQGGHTANSVTQNLTSDKAGSPPMTQGINITAGATL